MKISMDKQELIKYCEKKCKKKVWSNTLLCCLQLGLVYLNICSGKTGWVVINLVGAALSFITLINWTINTYKVNKAKEIEVR